jgi:hypothetical protein
VGLFVGQVTFLVFLGLIGSLLLIKKEKWFWAGAILIFTSIKPHMVILVLIYLLLIMATSKQFKGWVGLIVAGLTCVVILFAFRLEWFNDLIGLMSIAPVNWGTPTIGGLLSYLGVSEWARYMIVLLLPLPFILAFYKPKIKLEFAVALLTLITVPCTIFGWSSDQLFLLIPAAQVFNWVSGMKNQGLRTIFFLSMGSGVLINWCLRLFNTNEVFFLWYPIFWWLLFISAWILTALHHRRSVQLLPGTLNK